MLKNILVSEVRIKILQLFMLNPGQSYHVRAVVRSVGAEINAVRRELDNLVDLGLFTKRQSSNRIYYTVDTLHPFYIDLLSMCAKEQGLGSEILSRAGKLGDVEFVVLSRAYLRGRTSTALDVDLFVVGEPAKDVLDKIIKTEENRTGKEINYTVMPAEEFRFRKRSNDQFVNKILSQSRVMLFGDEEKFCSVI